MLSNLAFMKTYSFMHSFFYFFLAFFVLALNSFPASAETRFISDELRVPLRKSPCSNCAILHKGLPAGTQLTFVSSENEWAQVTTKDGLTGWLPQQYLVDKPIARQRLTAAEANTQMLVDDNSKLTTDLAELQQAFNEMEAEYTNLERHSSEIEAELTALKKLSANAIALQEQNEALVKDNRMLQSELDVLTATRDQLSNDSSHKWFLYGGITVFLGALLAILLPQLRPRKRFSEWS